MRNSHWHESYTTLDAWEEILALPGAQFINLQYDDSRSEVAEINHRPGISVHEFANLDLLGDFDGLAALIRNLDLVIAPANTVTALTGALGVRGWLLDLPANWGSLGTGAYPWFPSVTVYKRDRDMAGWSRVLGRVAKDLAKLTEVGGG